MDGDAANVCPPHFHFAGVDADPQREIERSDGLADGECAANGPGRAVERGDAAVTGRVDELAAETFGLPPKELLVAIENLPPSLVSQCASRRRRSDDVGEQQRLSVLSGSRSLRTPVRNSSISSTTSAAFCSQM
jgi:hypothetical protein